MKTIGLLSGKGGSGKTTLSLTMASLLSKSGIKTLLVDCDFSTNGATYFFEDQISESNELTFWEIIKGTNIKTKYIKIEENFFFIPSAKLNKPDNNQNFDQNEAKAHFILFLEEVSKEVDIILFDCQAGSSPILFTILPFVDAALMVLEPDKVSSSALKNLYTKLATILQDKQVYQVFNKVNESEKKFYEKVTFGTFFINVGALLYDWSIRTAFAFSIIPNIEGEAVSYGFQIADLCKKIINDKKTRDSIQAFEKKLLFKKKKRELDDLRSELSAIESKHTESKKKKRRQFFLRMFFYTATIGATIFTVFAFIFKEIKELERISPFFSSSASIMILSVLFGISTSFVFININNMEWSKEEGKEKELLTNIALLERQIEDIMKKET